MVTLVLLGHTWCNLNLKASSLLIRFFTLIETQFGKKIKQLRSDNAKELALTSIFQERGVLHQFSCIQCPE